MNKKIRKFLFCMILLILVSGYMAVFSSVTSPLYPNNYGVDSAFYRFIGKSILQGKTLYSDIWDNKGPVLFFIQALGALNGTRNADFSLIFILQVISVFGSVLLMYGAYSALHKQRAGDVYFLSAVVICGAVFCSTMVGGNLSEEWSLPFISCSLFLFARYLSVCESHPEHPRAYAFLHGICFGMIAFIRVNNAISICIGVLFICIYLMLKKQWKNLFSNILFGILGIAAVTLPVCLYFYAKNALSDMVYGVFLYNLKYIGDRAHKTYHGTAFFLRYGPVIASMLLILLRCCRQRKIRFDDLLSGGIVLGNAVILWQSNEYTHYFTIFIPVFFLILLLYGSDLKIPELLITAWIFIFFAVNVIPVFSDLAKDRDRQPQFSAADSIPAEEKKSSIAVWLTPEIYLNTGFEPVSRFCAYQFIHFPVDPSMLDEFLDDIRTSRPQWIIVLSGYEGIYEEVGKLLESDYGFAFTDSNANFYRRNQ